MPWAFRFDHLQPSKPILFWQFSKILTFILGGHFLLPQKANNGKREFSQLVNSKVDSEEEFSRFKISRKATQTSCISSIFICTICSLKCETLRSLKMTG